MQMARWLLAFTKGYDWCGRMKYLLKRDADAAQCQVPGVDAHVTEKALDIICEAFQIQPVQRHCLRPADIIQEIYGSITGLSDRMEIEFLVLNLERACGREIVGNEVDQIKTVADVILFLARNHLDGSTH
jgi:hypothetical protein